MKRPKGTQQKKKGKRRERIQKFFEKWKTTYYFLVLSTMALAALYAIVVRDRGISFPIGGKTVTILPGRSQKIVELESTIQKSHTDYDALAKSFKKYREEESIKISRLPGQLQGTCGEVEFKIKQMCDEISKRGEDIGFSFYMLQKIFDRDGTINTKMPTVNENRIQIYKHVQNCLSSIGAYNGKIDGKQASTYKAVTEFQKHNNLKQDGLIGKKTWPAITQKFEDNRVTETGM